MNLFNIIHKIKSQFDFIYSKSAQKTFKKCGKNITIIYPIYIKGGKHISLGNDIGLERNTRIEAWDEFAGCKHNPEIKIGNNVILNPNCHIGCINKIEIGNNVLIGANVIITDHSHGQTNMQSLKKCPNKRRLYSKGKVVIKDNVWIGENVAILPDVTVGRNAIIGANAVVTHDIPDNSVVGGNPARVIKTVT